MRDLTKALVEFNQFRTLGEKQLDSMLRAAIQFALDMQTTMTPHWLSLLGTSGAGKTMLARCISNVFRARMAGGIQTETEKQVTRYKGGFISWSRLANDLREGNYRKFDDICGDYLVVLDDIGSEHATDFVKAKLYELYARRDRKWTVTTANLSLEQIGTEVDPRIASRMIRHGSVVVDVDVQDFNLRRNAA